MVAVTPEPLAASLTSLLTPLDQARAAQSVVLPHPLAQLPDAATLRQSVNQRPPVAPSTMAHWLARRLQQPAEVIEALLMACLDKDGCTNGASRRTLHRRVDEILSCRPSDLVRLHDLAILPRLADNTGQLADTAGTTTTRLAQRVRRALGLTLATYNARPGWEWPLEAACRCGFGRTGGSGEWVVGSGEWGVGHEGTTPEANVSAPRAINNLPCRGPMRRNPLAQPLSVDVDVPGLTPLARPEEVAHATSLLLETKSGTKPTPHLFRAFSCFSWFHTVPPTCAIPAPTRHLPFRALTRSVHRVGFSQREGADHRHPDDGIAFAPSQRRLEIRNQEDAPGRVNGLSPPSPGREPRGSEKAHATSLLLETKSGTKPTPHLFHAFSCFSWFHTVPPTCAIPAPTRHLPFRALTRSVHRVGFSQRERAESDQPAPPCR